MKLRRDKREQRKREGQARNEAWVQLTTEEKMRSLAVRRGSSLRQTEKLTGQRIPAWEYVAGI